MFGETSLYLKPKESLCNKLHDGFGSRPQKLSFVFGHCSASVDDCGAAGDERGVSGSLIYWV